MRKILIFGLAVAISACSSPVLPDREREISDFVPTTEIERGEGSEVFDFAERNFPKNCEWQPLVRVVDGDTIETRDFRVRFIGINTPETKHPRKPVQKFGPEATQKTESLLKNSKKVCLISSKIGDDFDKYHRKLSYVFSEQGVDVNAELLRVGLARGYFWFPFDRKAEFRAIEKSAKKAKIGIWGG